MDDLEARFQELLKQWEKDTEHLSFIRADHPAYQEMIRMGMPAVPFILRELKRRPSWLFDLLHRITGEWPCPEKHAGRLCKLSEDRLRWGKDRGYIG